MHLIDTHTHIYDPAFNMDRPEQENGVKTGKVVVE